DDMQAGGVVFMCAVTEVQAKYVDAGIQERGDALARGAGGAERGDNACASLSCHGVSLLGMAHDGQRTKMARKSLTLVSVGPVITASSSASKKPWPSLSSRLSRGRK